MNNSILNDYIPSLGQVIRATALVALSIVVFYVNPMPQLKVFYMIGLGIVYYFSEDRISFVVLLNFIYDRVLSLFEEGTLDTTMTGAPIITLGQGISIGIRDVLLLVIVSKVVSKKEILYSGRLLSLIVLYGYGFLVGFGLGGVNVSSLVFAFRTYGLLLLYFYLFSKMSLCDMYKLLHIISYFLFPVVFDQIYTFIAGERLSNSLFNVGRTFQITESVVRLVPYGLTTIMFSLIYGFMLLSVDRKVQRRFASPLYGSILIGLSIVSIMLSSQRGQAAVFVVILFVASRGIIHQYKSMATLAISFVLMFFLLNSLGFGIDFVAKNLGTRIGYTINPLFRKQIDEIDTSGRNYEIPVLVKTMKESPIVGYGLNIKTEFLINNNFGFPNTIIKFGLFGLVLVLLLIFSWIMSLHRANKILPLGSPEYASILVVNSALIGMLLGYLTTIDYFTSSLDWDYYRLAVLMALSSLAFKVKNEYLTETSREH